MTLAAQHAAQELEYRTLVAQLEEEGGRSVERSGLQSALAEAEAAAREQSEKEASRADLLTRRSQVLRRVSELRDRRFAIRKGVAEKLTRQFPILRVSVEQGAGLDRYCDLLAEHLKGTGMQRGQVATRLSEALVPTELCDLVRAGDLNAIANRSGLDVDRARKVADALTDAGAIYDIEAVDLDDYPRIELKDGQRFKGSAQLSTGQRCTTILPILLVQSERPLLIDQPEDNLDNAFVYDTVVTALRAVKGSRQVIFVTHNPNIPVLGEADRVFVFNSDGQHASLEQVGTVDECKDHIERLLEGGRDAFLQRKARYGH
jgi:ATPase subunit of ABC transporter with duplicated ATPase domains